MPNSGCNRSSSMGCDMRSCEAFLAEPIVPSAFDNRANTPLCWDGRCEEGGTGEERMGSCMRNIRTYMYTHQ